MAREKIGRFPDSPLYEIDGEAHAREREQRMIAELDAFFWKSFFMLRFNGVEGDYLEFGSGSGIRSFRLAYKYRTLEHPSLRLFSFDSFAGLPEPVGIDEHPLWKQGAMSVTMDEFRTVMRSVGASEGDYQMVPGYYDKTLDEATPADYGITKAAMVFVDCDLYQSTVSVLNFVRDVLTDGAVLAFDDWYCYSGSPAKGEQRAFNEFRERNPQLQFSEYLNFGWHGKSFIVHTS